MLVFLPVNTKALSEEDDVFSLDFEAEMKKFQLNESAEIVDGTVKATIPNPTEYSFARVMVTPLNSNESLFPIKSMQNKVSYRVKITGAESSQVDYIAFRLKGKSNSQAFITLHRDITLNQWYEGAFTLNEMTTSNGKNPLFIGEEITEVRMDGKNSSKEENPITIHVDYIHVTQPNPEDTKDPEIIELEQTLQRQVAEAEPGDTVVVPNGNYKDFEASFVGNGTENKPIMITAETPGGVTFRGDTQITLTGNYLTFENFHFDHANPSGRHYLLGLDNLSHSRINGNFFNHSGPPDPYAGVIRVQNQSQSNRIDHNTFKNNVAMGIAIRVNDQNNLKNQYNTIDHNYFKDIPEVSELYPDEDNGLEAIQIGQGYGYEQADVYTTVDSNLFENITGDGSEIISNKTAHNVYRHNTFKNSDSGFTLRFGAHNIVEKNVFLRTKYGIRVTDQQQTIKNNYMFQVEQGIRVLAGRHDAEAEEGRQMNYIPVENAKINNNVIMYPSSQAIVIGDGFSFNPAPKYTYYEPKESELTDNRIVLHEGSAIHEVAADHMTYKNNRVEITSDNATIGNIETGIHQQKLKMNYNSNLQMYHAKKEKDYPIPLTKKDVGPLNKWWLQGWEETADQIETVTQASINEDTVTKLVNKGTKIKVNGENPVKLIPHILKNKDYIAFDVRANNNDFPSWDTLIMTTYEKHDKEEWRAEVGSIKKEWRRVIIPIEEFYSSSFVHGNHTMDKQELQTMTLQTLSGMNVEVKNFRIGQFHTEEIINHDEEILLPLNADKNLSDMVIQATYKGGYQAPVAADEITWEIMDTGLLTIKDNHLRTVGKTGKTKITATYRDFTLDIPVKIVKQTIIDVKASDEPQPENNKENTIDGDLTTRWSAEGEQWIQYELREEMAINKVQLAWMNGNKRITYFDIETSVDGNTWNEIFSGESSGETSELETYPFSDTYVKYVRINGHGNSENNWNSLAEIVISEVP
ncbi:chondroitinase-B domain-containing protein [Gracilibacillus phocaeensis]|uniref:chondroitinase-B domain-containing protein n=1 Tax=Gracilibacillus phocaeensis TaxID=2042304 RepID=UPI0013EF517B|nr:chondroitinase-B domain-containing protein [Gracilibacillus phocaeensis]